MGKRITIIQGHPDSAARHFGHALADAYAEGAQAAGHEVRRIELARLDYPVLRAREEWERGQPPASIRQSQDSIEWASHLVIVYPLWLGAMPALLKAFLEQVFRPGFAFEYRASGMPKKLLKGRSARIVVTMGMPAFVYRWYFRAHSLKNLERNILGFVGIGPIRASLIGMVEGGQRKRERWIKKMRALGQAGR
ncbi:MAG: NAD(P)H-dependent oxidoreductase [Gammaproteobacteria bacterium]